MTEAFCAFVSTSQIIEPYFELIEQFIVLLYDHTTTHRERRVSEATFYNILSGVFPVDRRMVGIVFKHGYILHIYPTSMKDEKNN